MSVLVLESHEEGGVEWGVSLNGPNPEPPDYLHCVDRAQAEAVATRLAFAEAAYEWFDNQEGKGWRCACWDDYVCPAHRVMRLWPEHTSVVEEP